MGKQIDRNKINCFELIMMMIRHLKFWQRCEGILCWHWIPLLCKQEMCVKHDLPLNGIL